MVRENDVENVLRAILMRARYYFVKVKTAVRIRFYFLFKSRLPLLIYQMGKVGSSTVLRSLEAIRIRYPVYQVHTLTEQGIKEAERVIQNSHKPFHLRRHIWLGQYLSEQIQKPNRHHEKWKIITMVRDPVSRDISTFFQTLSLWVPDSKELCNAEYADVDMIKERFLQIFAQRAFFLEWFDSELKQVFDIDVYSREFPHYKGYQVYEGDKAEVLLIRLEDLNKCAEEAVGNFLNIRGFTLMNENISDRKIYSDIYRKFVKNVVLPSSYIERCYGSRMARHFYTEEEISEFRKRWKGIPVY